jgi:TetR/AcrR family transcriptional regulator, transcriptional repressor for nem operon
MSPPTTSPRPRGRPRKVDADQRETRELLCRAGVAALTEKGFTATGIEEVLSAVGIPKGSFYHFFASKQAFGAELITLYADYFGRKLDHFLLDEAVSPLARINAFCQDAEAGMARFDFRRGCLVGNLGQEMNALPEDFRAQLSAVLDDWAARLARCLQAAQAAGELPPGLDTARWATYFWMGWEGAVLRAKLARSGQPLRLFAELFQAGLRCAT